MGFSNKASFFQDFFILGFVFFFRSKTLSTIDVGSQGSGRVYCRGAIAAAIKAMGWVEFFGARGDEGCVF